MIAQFQSIIFFAIVQGIIKKELNNTFTDSEDKYHTHTLRHTGVTLMYDENNTDILIIKEILGHKSRKQAKLEYTYQQILATQAEQVNNKANLHNTNTKMAENMLESTNILDFDKIAKKT